MSTYAASHTAAIRMPSIVFGSPGDWHRWWMANYYDFLEILHAACDPDGQETYIENRIERFQLWRR